MVVYEAQPFFQDRTDAGKHLAERLIRYQSEKPVVFAVPRGGIPVAIEVADHLDAPLDITVARKIPIPQEPEAGYGAVAEDGTIVLNQPMVEQLGLKRQEISKHARQVRAEIERRITLYRSYLSPSPVEDKTAIVIDDGLASGYTMIAAVKSLQQRKAFKIIVAVPVASGTAYDLVKAVADEVVSLVIARIRHFAVASFYHNWYDLTDEDVTYYLEDWRLRRISKMGYLNQGKNPPGGAGNG